MSEWRFTVVTISIDLSGESMKWKVKFAAATRLRFCSHHQKGNGTVQPCDAAPQKVERIAFSPTWL
jgi:hypothetical protein